MMGPDEVILEHASLYYCCQRCSGLMTVKTESPSDVLQHLTSCDGIVANSPCELFALDKETCLMLATSVKKKCEVVKKTKLKTEKSTDVGFEEVNRALLDPVYVNVGGCHNKDDTDDISELCKSETVISISTEPENVQVVCGPERKSSRIDVKQKAARLDLSQTKLMEECSVLKFEDNVHKPIDETENTESNSNVVCNTNKAGQSNATVKLPGRTGPVTKAWLEHRENLEKKYTEFVISSHAAVGGKSKKYYVKQDKCYQCPQCQWRTSHVGHFHRHLQLRHDATGAFQCKYCEYSCVDGKSFKRHVAQHEKPFKCDKCTSTFSAKKDLQRHVWKHSGLQPFKCDQCDFRTRFKEAMRNHVRKHTGEKLRCVVDGCDFESTYPSSLRQHVNHRHPTVDSNHYKCDYCSYSTFYRHNWDDHQKRHANEKNYLCSQCTFRGINKAQVVSHMKVHTREKTYYCDQCDYASAHGTTFSNHMMMHANLKPFQCSICSYSSTTKQKVQRHIMHRVSCSRADILHHNQVKIDLSQYRRDKDSRKSYSIVDTVSASDEASVAEGIMTALPTVNSLNGQFELSGVSQVLTDSLMSEVEVVSQNPDDIIIIQPMCNDGETIVERVLDEEELVVESMVSDYAVDQAVDEHINMELTVNEKEIILESSVVAGDDIAL